MISQGAIARREIKAARQYTIRLLDDFDGNNWFRQPAEGVTHVAWQVGHLAVAQFSLAVNRLRGDQADDEQLLPFRYRQLFGRDSAPQPDPTLYPAPAEIRATFDGVHAYACALMADFSDADLEAVPIGKPHPLFHTKLGGLFWCARHEMLHAGQIGLLKRLVGRAPQW